MPGSAVLAEAMQRRRGTYSHFGRNCGRQPWANPEGRVIEPTHLGSLPMDTPTQPLIDQNQDIACAFTCAGLTRSSCPGEPGATCRCDQRGRIDHRGGSQACRAQCPVRRPGTAWLTVKVIVYTMQKSRRLNAAIFASRRPDKRKTFRVSVHPVNRPLPQALQLARTKVDAAMTQLGPSVTEWFTGRHAPAFDVANFDSETGLSLRERLSTPHACHF